MTVTYADQLDLLQAVAEAHRTDAEVVESVILADARAHGGEVNPNRVRVALRATGVRPQVVGAVFSGMVRRGWLERVGDVPNEDLRSRNRNKDSGLYHLSGLAEFSRALT